jgi:hypothetical protein
MGNMTPGLIPEMSSHLTERVLLDGAYSPQDEIRQDRHTAPKGISSSEPFASVRVSLAPS